MTLRNWWWASLLLLTGCYASASDLADEGETALRNFRLADAETAFEEALKRDPTLPRALYGLGWIYFSQGDISRARLYFERCLQADPNFYGCHRGMGSLHLSMGFMPQAEESLKRAVTLRPEDAASTSSLAHLYLTTKRLGEAEPLFQKAMTLEPDRGEAWLGMAELRYHQQRDNDALTLLDEAQKRTIAEVKFVGLMHELRGRIYMRQAREVVRGRGDPPAEPWRSQAINLLGQASAEFERGLAQEVLADRTGLQRLKQKVDNLQTQLREGVATP